MMQWRQRLRGPNLCGDGPRREPVHPVMRRGHTWGLRTRWRAFCQRVWRPLLRCVGALTFTACLAGGTTMAALPPWPALGVAYGATYALALAQENSHGTHCRATTTVAVATVTAKLLSVWHASITTLALLICPAHWLWWPKRQAEAPHTSDARAQAMEARAVNEAEARRREKAEKEAEAKRIATDKQERQELERKRQQAADAENRRLAENEVVAEQMHSTSVHTGGTSMNVAPQQTVTLYLPRDEIVASKSIPYQSDAYVGAAWRCDGRVLKELIALVQDAAATDSPARLVRGTDGVEVSFVRCDVSRVDLECRGINAHQVLGAIRKKMVPLTDADVWVENNVALAGDSTQHSRLLDASTREDEAETRLREAADRECKRKQEELETAEAADRERMRKQEAVERAADAKATSTGHAKRVRYDLLEANCFDTKIKNARSDCELAKANASTLTHKNSDPASGPTMPSRRRALTKRCPVVVETLYESRLFHRFQSRFYGEQYGQIPC